MKEEVNVSGEEVEVVAYMDHHDTLTHEAPRTEHFALMTVSQHSRIVGALHSEAESERDQLRAEVERLKAQLAEEIQRRFDGNEISSNEHREEVQRLQAQLAQQQGVPDGWRVERSELDGSVCFIIGAPRLMGVRSNTSVWESDSDPAHLLLWHMLAAAPAPAQAEPASPWVAVSERLPQIRQILSEKCTLEGRGLPTLYRSGEVIWYDGKRVSAGIVEWFHGKSPLSGVTHWMPLPPAPEVV